MAGENLDLLGALADLEQERGIDRETLLQAVEAALISAYRRNYGTTENVGVHIDRDTGQMDLFVSKRIVDEVEDPDQEIGVDEARGYDPSYQTGDIIEFPVLVRDFGRIAAQTAKQVVVQRIREAERGMIYDEYVQREGDIITGVVQRTQGRTAFIDLGKAEAVLPASEVPAGEYYNPGDRVKVFLVEVRRTTKGPQLLVSRTHPGLLKRLFELEVPEIHDGLVEVMGIAREAGARSKFAVFSREEHVDPVGACVGHKGMRVQTVVNELRGEKIDIIKWSPDPGEYVGNALSPSKVSQVLLREDEKVARVIVPDYQLSLAIGRAGQNARLAAKLTGWRIDIRSESQLAEEGGELQVAGAVGVPSVPWAGGLTTGSTPSIVAPWEVAPEPAAADPAAGGDAASEALGAEVPAAGDVAVETADADGVATAADAAGVDGVPADADGTAAGADAVAATSADGEAGAGADVDDAQSETPGEAAAADGAPADGAAAAAATTTRTARAKAKPKPKKKAAPKVRNDARVIHAASLAEGLAEAGLAAEKASANGAEVAAGAAAPNPEGAAGAEAQGDAAGAPEAADGAGSGGETSDTADEGPIDEATVEALEQRASGSDGRRGRRARRPRGEDAAAAREEE